MYKKIKDNLRMPAKAWKLFFKKKEIQGLTFKITEMRIWWINLTY